MASKEMVYLQGYAKRGRMWQLLAAINSATELHHGQSRKGGEPYIDHPTRVCSSLVALGIEDELILATAMLHDVIEDCGIRPQELTSRFGISDEIVNAVCILSKNKNLSTEEYYIPIRNSRIATLVKIADRCHNFSTMVGAFTPEKMRDYIIETNEFVIPLCKRGRRYYPQHSDAIISMKYQLEALRNSISGLLDMILALEPKNIIVTPPLPKAPASMPDRIRLPNRYRYYMGDE